MTSDLKERRDRASSLKKQGNVDEALKMYQSLWVETKDKWDGWNLVQCMNKNKQYNDAYDISREVYKQDPDFDYLKGPYAFAGYMVKIKDYKPEDDYGEIFKPAIGVMELTEKKKDDLARQLTVLKMLEICEKQSRWEDLIEWSGKIDSDVLSTGSFKTQVRGKNVSLPSNRVKWFLKVTKAYEKLEQWDKCYEISCEAIRQFPDDVWFKRRKAISVGYNGELDQAISDLINISLTKSDWFIFRDIAMMYIKKDDYKKALEYLIEGCLVSVNIPDPGYRWELYYYAALCFQKNNEEDLSKKHLLLSFSLRDNEGWKTPEVLSDLASELGVELDPIEDTKKYMKELKSYWTKQKFSSLPKNIGTIKTILPNGKAGFITSDDGEDYYFKVFSYNGNRKGLVRGMKVEFYKQESFDRVKNKKSFQAVNISNINKKA